MPNFKLECEHRFPWDESLDIRNTTEFNYDHIDSVLQGMTDFLRGCGFVFDGELQIVDETKPNRIVNDDMQEYKPDSWVADVGDKPTQEEKEEWQGVGSSVAMQWTVNELMKGPTNIESISGEK